MSFAVIGTDTDVGKTLVSMLMLLRYQSRGLGYFKPVASGEPSDTHTVRNHLHNLGVPIAEELYHFKSPVSPHLAAAIEQRSIDPNRIVQTFHALRTSPHPWLVEGAGGLLTPLTYEGTSLAHVIQAMGLPCVLVTRGTLGTLNHTCLTVEAARTRNIPLLGLVVSGAHTPENLQDLTRLTQLPLIDVVEPLAEINAHTLQTRAASFDPEGILHTCL